VTTQPLGRVVQKLRQTLQADSLATDSDAELLSRVRANRDPAALEAIVNRHGPRVLAACRKVLRDDSDIDDAFQATFLVLLRGPGAVRRGSSLGAWLYGVAHRVSLQARTAQARRNRIEGRAKPFPSRDLTWADACTALHEELDRLADAYRLPLMLCYLEGLSRDEAAGRLGCKLGLIKKRLERGRQLLRTRLKSRGIALSTGLLAAVAETASSQTVPLRIVQGVVASLDGVVPSSVASLANRVHHVPIRTIFVGCLAASIVITCIALGQAGQTPNKAMPAKPGIKDAKVAPVAKKESANTITVSGKVIDPDGKPVAGAKFVVSDDEVEEKIAPVRSDAEGKFRFEMVYPKTVRNPRQVIASAPGYGLAWLSEPRENVLFELVPDLPIKGRVIDLQGKPVGGAKVSLHNIHVGTTAAFKEFVKNWKKSKNDQDHAASKLDRAIFNRGGLGQAIHTTTATDGTFTMNGCGKDRVVTLLITGDGIADTFADVVTRDGFDPKGGPKTPMRLYPPNLDVVVNPDKPITGIVRDEETQKPLAGVRVSGASMVGKLLFGSYHFHAWPTPNTTTDAAGKFTLRGLAKAKAYILVADPEEGTEHLHRFAHVEDTTAFTPITTGFSLPHGVVVTGRITDAKTGAGVASRVFYRPLLINDQLDKFGGYDPPDYPAPWHRGRDTKTDMEGRYKITVMPGAGVINFQTYGGSYQTARATQKEIDDGIVDKQFGHFRTIGQGGMFNPEFMQAYNVIRPNAKDRTATLDVQVNPAEPPKTK
jgi:RNA polymerase sigma factor (sigma-70 family)